MTILFVLVVLCSAGDVNYKFSFVLRSAGDVNYKFGFDANEEVEQDVRLMDNLCKRQIHQFAALLLVC